MDLSKSTSPQNGTNNAEAAAPLDLTTQPIQPERIASDFPSPDQHPPTGQYSVMHQLRAELLQLVEAAVQSQPSLLFTGVSGNGPNGAPGDGTSDGTSGRPLEQIASITRSQQTTGSAAPPASRARLASRHRRRSMPRAPGELDYLNDSSYQEYRRRVLAARSKAGASNANMRRSAGAARSDDQQRCPTSTTTTSSDDDDDTDTSQEKRRLKTEEALIRLTYLREKNVGMMLELEEYERRYDLPPFAKELLAKFRLLLAQEVGVKE